MERLSRESPDNVFVNKFKDLKGFIRIPKKDVEDYYNMNILTKRKLNEATGYEKFVIMSDIHNLKNTPYKETLNIFNSFAKEILNNAKDKNSVTYIFNTLSFILTTIEKEILNYDDNEIVEMILKKLEQDKRVIVRKILFRFLNYCRINFRSKCKFKDAYNIGSINRTRNNEIYTLETWKSFYKYFTNIDKHIDLAFKHRFYCQLWLYAVLHFSIAWRAGDIVKLPTLDLNVLDIEFLEFEKWIKNGNKFTLSTAEKVIKNIKIKIECNELRTQKTNAILHFNIPNDLKIPTAIAFVIANTHKVKSQDNVIFTRKAGFSSTDFKRWMSDINEVLTNRKANKTLLTLAFEEANTIEGEIDLAYCYSSYLRSHKMDRDIQVATTTERYILMTNTDGCISKVALNLFRRGTFGWLYRILLKLAYNENEFKKITTEEITSTIEELRKQYNLIGVEMLSGFLNERMKKDITDLIIELSCIPKRKLITMVEKISKGESPSKMQDGQCLKKCMKNPNCPFERNTTCIGCKFLIPQAYILISVKNELYRLLDELDNTYEHQENDIIKISYIIWFNILPIIQEAKIEFDEYDKDYVDTLIDLQELKLKLNHLIQKGKLIHRSIIENRIAGLNSLITTK